MKVKKARETWDYNLMFSLRRSFRFAIITQVSARIIFFPTLCLIRVTNSLASASWSPLVRLRCVFVNVLLVFSDRALVPLFHQELFHGSFCSKGLRLGVLLLWFQFRQELDGPLIVLTQIVMAVHLLATWLVLLRIVNASWQSWMCAFPWSLSLSFCRFSSACYTTSLTN